jgi:modification methylase
VPTSVKQRVETKPAHDRKGPKADYEKGDPDTRVYIGDCRELLASVPDCRDGKVDLIFADPPFNWNRDYDRWKASHPDAPRSEYETWHDGMPREDYLDFTRQWLDGCRRALRPGGALWVNIPDDTAAEIVVYLKGPGATPDAPAMEMVNWCVWHYRFGQNRSGSFINSKVHALYFVKPGGLGAPRTWNTDAILEPSDRATTYFDPRTQSKKDGMPPGMRVPMDVWYGKFWGRIQGNNEERRHGHDNQLPEVYLDRVVQCSSNLGDIVLDPFLGSGTTGTVARARGRKFIGFEYSQANAASAWERMTKIGMLRSDPSILRQSTAIHKPRRKRRASDK